MMLTILNTKSKYDITGEVREVLDDVVGLIVVGRGAALPNPPSYITALKFLEKIDELSVEEVLGALSRIRGIFVGNKSKLEEINKCWRFIGLAGKLIENLELKHSWCSCIGLTSNSIGKRVAFERIPTPELALSGNVIVGVELFDLKCRKIEFRDLPLIKFKETKPPQSLIDILADIVEASIGDVVENLEGVVEDIGRVVEDAVKREIDELNTLLSEALKEGVAYVELDKLADEIFNNVCKKVGTYALDLRNIARRRLML
ncbi:MAG: hypothetical protein QXO97_04680 [Candidatus Nezhaarchaeales archaeon]